MSEMSFPLDILICLVLLKVESGAGSLSVQYMLASCVNAPSIQKVAFSALSLFSMTK